MDSKTARSKQRVDTPAGIQSVDSDILLHAMRGHITALDHAVRLLIAASPEREVLQDAWRCVVEDLTNGHSADPNHFPNAFKLGFDQCTNRISCQLHAREE
ncbi:hypothetical protein [Stenotrophomonas sp. SAU14A_NAIMI4_8]|uniref:hypothetical protein n=1 Tax=Stenotrophomonas sp. SAU14A_NAIMI4_8 TaxID=2072409 RepID=UPI000D53FE35|nr:hypothetical protein [Stenotrophomonas sp. SAU14A_NAIMI4_8]AWH33938.1 hypothetical protein C1930_14245 [Stenotrophomonas sp. SAU14A_NAIMI4_8]